MSTYSLLYACTVCAHAKSRYIPQLIKKPYEQVIEKKKKEGVVY